MYSGRKFQRNARPTLTHNLKTFSNFGGKQLIESNTINKNGNLAYTTLDNIDSDIAMI